MAHKRLVKLEQKRCVSQKMVKLEQKRRCGSQIENLKFSFGGKGGRYLICHYMLKKVVCERSTSCQSY